jgi:putative pyrimidine permease RutG
MFGFPHWQLKSTSTGSGVVAPDERLPYAQTAVMGVQHAVAMFGATVLMPILMGLDPNLSILMSGVGTLLFFLLTGGRVPSYLGSSAAFVGVVIAATGFSGQGVNPNLSVALGGIIACGFVYTLIGLIVMKSGTRWIERLMPPVVTGAVVMAIGLNLAPIAVKGVSGSAFDSWMAVMTVLCIGLVAVFTRGMVQRLLILVGLIMACLLYALVTNVLGLGKPVDFTLVQSAAWFGLPQLTSPTFSGQAMMLIAPVAVILVAENLGHLKAVAGMTGRLTSTLNGCDLWWLEWGGRLDTVHESETIKWELWKIVWGVWNYIKNSGEFPDADNLTIEWVGAIPGKRESRFPRQNNR